MYEWLACRGGGGGRTRMAATMKVADHEMVEISTWMIITWANMGPGGSGRREGQDTTGQLS